MLGFCFCVCFLLDKQLADASLNCSFKTMEVIIYNAYQLIFKCLNNKSLIFATIINRYMLQVLLLSFNIITDILLQSQCMIMIVNLDI